MAEYGKLEILDVAIEEKFEYKKLLYPGKYKDKAEDKKK